MTPPPAPSPEQDHLDLATNSSHCSTEVLERMGERQVRVGYWLPLLISSRGGAPGAVAGEVFGDSEDCLPGGEGREEVSVADGELLPSRDWPDTGTSHYMHQD